ncbi:MAG: DUF420 domain-containing protein [Verrucomicrobiota bacterium]
MSFSLPALNAVLNGSAVVCLTMGFALIRKGRVREHRIAMISALVISGFFLFFYLLDKYLKDWQGTPFPGDGFWRAFYIIMLATHVILSMVMLPMIFRTLYLAIRGRYEIHRKWARVTYPIWYYVSVTGVMIYFFLYHWPV